MEALGSAASIVAVVDLTVKLSALCVHYHSEVKDSKQDIEMLLEELKRLQDNLQAVQVLLDGPNGSQLQASWKLQNGLSGCHSRLIHLRTELQQKLSGSSRQKVMSRFGIRALKWPFESKDVSATVAEIRRYRDDLAATLAADQTSEVLHLSQTLNLSRLPVAVDAAYNSRAHEHEARCHPETRVDLLRQVQTWSLNPNSASVFWLNGVAGTGKSTVSRTLAASFDAQAILGASFFFKRGEKDRGNSSLLFTTVSSQLAQKFPALAPGIRHAIESDASISNKTLKEQFEKLILAPLRSLSFMSAGAEVIVILIDALDECDEEDDIRLIIHLLSQEIKSNPVPLKTFFTSRPELPVRLGFQSITGEYEDFILHEIPKPIIGSDIAIYLRDELATIRSDYNMSVAEERQLAQDWPGEGILNGITEMAVPLFIFAATVCRFISDRRQGSPHHQLQKLLKYQMKGQNSKLGSTYRPILDQQILNMTQVEKEDVVRDFRTIVGTIITLAEPLSSSSLALLLQLPKSRIDDRLDFLHSALEIPRDSNLPVRLFHLSFRDFLVDNRSRDVNPFWIDEEAAHQMIGVKCLELLSSNNWMRQDICNLQYPGATRSNLPLEIIDSCLPIHVRYACLYWIYHIARSNILVTEKHQVFCFLQKHFLHWLEALSLLGKVFDSVVMLSSLQAVVCYNDSVVALFLKDAIRFVRVYQSIIDLHPLQTYSSALYFTPSRSPIRALYKEFIPEWIQNVPEIDKEWDFCLQTFEGHKASGSSVLFSPDGATIASGAWDSTIRLWNAVTGKLKQELSVDGSMLLRSVIFSPDSRRMAAGYSDKTVRIWDTIVGKEMMVLEGHNDTVSGLAFNLDGKSITSVTHDGTIYTWNLDSGNVVEKLEDLRDAHQLEKTQEIGAYVSPEKDLFWMGYRRPGTVSADADTIAFSFVAHTIWIFGLKRKRRKPLPLRGHHRRRPVFSISANGNILASVTAEESITLWNTETGARLLQVTMKGWNEIYDLVISPDGTLIACLGGDKFQLIDAKSGQGCVTIPHRIKDVVGAIAISPDSNYVGTAPSDVIRLYDIQAHMGSPQELTEVIKYVTDIALSTDGQTAASISGDATIRLWNTRSGEEKTVLCDREEYVTNILFSPNSDILASGSTDGTIRLWNMFNNELEFVFRRYHNSITALSFAPDGSTLASASSDGTICLWDPIDGSLKHVLEDLEHRVVALAFSPDGSIIASALLSGAIFLWDVMMGNLIKVLRGRHFWVMDLAFSLDGVMLASASEPPKGSTPGGTAIWIWNTTTAEKVTEFNIGSIPSPKIWTMHFVGGGRYLNFNGGYVDLSAWGALGTHPLTEDPKHLSIDGQWLCRGEEKIMWLPPENRPSVAAYGHNIVAMGHGTGKVRFIRLSFP